MGCTDSVSFILTSPPALTISSTSIADHGSGDGQAGVTISGGIPPYTYSWSNGINNTATISNLNSGLYTCVVMDSNNCQIVEDIMVALEYPQLLTTLNPASISVLPNPCQHQLWIQHTSAKSWKQLYTQFGQLVISTQQNPLDVSQLAKGVYYLRCEGQQLKVIKE
ncbi:MAG TPA: T9SS type A sorting domain-containing protein [Chitinophagaceae bacterium]|nr:T9SS type A sorting domain-containing protein [Chitinophagaceae bacterium]